MKTLMLFAITFLFLSFGWAVYVDITGDHTAVPLAYTFFIMFLLISYPFLKRTTNKQ